MDATLIPRLSRFEVVAYGCHERARRVITDVLHRMHTSVETFQFTEYFTLAPIAAADADSWQSAQVYYPFIRRVAEENQFLWTINEQGSFALHPRSPELLAVFDDPLRFLIDATRTRVGAKVFDEWRSAGMVGALPIVDLMPPSAWEDTLLAERRIADEDARNALLLEYGLLGVPWHVSQQNCVMYTYPIASDALFYGYFVLITPDDGTGCRDLLAPLRNTMNEIVANTYLPVLAFLHQTLIEQDLLSSVSGRAIELKSASEDNAAALALEVLRHAGRAITADAIPFLRLLDDQSRRALPLEKELCSLWQRRKVYITKSADANSELPSLLRSSRHFIDSLVFAKYHVASPGMVEEVTRVVTQSKELKAPDLPGKALPAALVFGTPGAGKDTLARMIPIFTNEYFEDPIFTINMSALRPDFLTGPLLQGLTVLDAQTGTEQKKAGFFLEGLFIAAARPASVPPERHHAAGKRKATFILDELNSLHIDLQGILLRILEQGEVTPLLGLDAGAVEHLVIGIVNEDPLEISRQAEIASIVFDKSTFGSLLGGLLYEVMRRSRRLRDDLFHRLKRNLYVSIPTLDNRREDIPILFYDAITRIKRDARVDLAAYRQLMNPGLHWPGNVRDVQEVAQYAAAVMRDNRVTHADVRAALKRVPHISKSAALDTP